MLKRSGKGITQQLPSLVKHQQFAAVQQPAVRRGSSGTLKFHSESQSLLDELTLEVRLGNEGKMGHGKTSLP